MSTTTHTITHSASGATCRIHEFGATITSFKTAAGRECLFTSRDAKLDGTKAIRGGIPLVFPIFGPPSESTSSMPQHGFLRNNVWKVDESTFYDTPEAAGMECSLELKDVDAGRGEGNGWAKSTPEYDCTVVLAVKVEASQLTTTLTVKNTGQKAFPFQALFHTYYQVDDHAALSGTHCFVKGLGAYSVDDKISGESYVMSSSDPVIIQGIVDNVYTPPLDKLLDVTIGVGPSKTMRMTAHGQVGGAPVPTSCVVWNPHKAKAQEMGDYGSDQYVDMICVEPGILGNPILEVGQTAEFVQVMMQN
jgi:glucose-6-phosphate 1-epimerase